VNLSAAEKLARAVLYEGYMLYPYRPSSVKNRLRFNFGVIHPAAQGKWEPSSVETEFLVQAGNGAALEVRLRFLQLVDRSISRALEPARELPSHLEPVVALEVEDRLYQSWQEAIEQEVSLAVADLTKLGFEPACERFSLPAGRREEAIRNRQGLVAGVIHRRREELRGCVETAAVPLGDGVFRITLRISNESRCDLAATRGDALINSLVSAHFVLGVEGGAFVSLLDPPPEFAEHAASCHNSRMWPILVGQTGARDTLLCSPILLYDYPQIAPESPGDLFDGTEIDEILSLRILTMTEEEKREMRDSDERARRILERTEALASEDWMRLHGAFRGSRSSEEKAS
jgi:hypothetical protein